MEANKSRQYRPTSVQWNKLINETEFTINEQGVYASMVELINFKTSKVHFKGGKRIAFDCLSEAQFIHVCNGGYYEDAPLIDNKNRI
jgi:hypothetical protein